MSSASMCAPEDDTSIGLLAYARALAKPEADLVETATAYGIRETPPDQVFLVVTDEKLCTRAAGRFKEESGRRNGLQRPVHVIQIGATRNSNRYIVIDPIERAGEFGIAMVFDARFELIKSFTY